MFDKIVDRVLDFVLKDWKLSSVLEKVFLKQGDWKGDIGRLRGSFTREDMFKVSPFLNGLLEALKEAGVGKAQVENFVQVFNELMDNAFSHGCQARPNGRIKVQCVYSRWFIYLRVKDSGGGFDLQDALRKSRDTSTRRGIAHGLQIVNHIAHQLSVDKGAVTATLPGQSFIDAIPTVEVYDGQEILIITVTSDDTWYAMKRDWRPLHDLLYNARQHLFLIDLSEMRISSKSVVDLIEEVSSQPTFYVAEVGEQGAISGSLGDLYYSAKPTAKFAFIVSYNSGVPYESIFPPIFRDDQFLEAREWLVRGNVG